MESYISLFPLLVILASALLILGLLLLWRGLWPRRKGDAPHCRKCDYNLTALESDNCPECGSPMTPHLVVRGPRRKRPGLIVTGCLCLLPALFVAGGSMTRVDWYRHMPAGWVISNLQSTSPATSLRAWKELDRRIKAGELSPRHQSALCTGSA